jgi:phosphoglucosamine mutase
VAALQILRVMKNREQPLSKLVQCWKRYPQVTHNIRVLEKRPFESLDGVTDLVAKADAELKPMGGRVVLRYSGTEPKARLLLEGPDQRALDLWANQIGEVIRRHVGV